LFVIVKDFIFSQIGLSRQGIDTVEDFIKLLALSCGPLPHCKALRPFL
jgi:hypothetical protein